jgi:anti-anti-sigma regulatory factor
MPTKTPANAVVYGAVDREQYTVEKVYLQSFPGHFVTGSLYRPKGHSGRLPGVLCPHGHWANGRFHDHGEKQIQAQIEQVVQAGAHDIVLDLTAVAYLSSAGIRMLSSLFHLLRGNLPQESDAAMKQGIHDGTFKSPHLKLAGPPPRVAEVLKMSGLDMVIDMYRSVPEAVASF